MIVPKGEEQTSIDGKMLNSYSSSGWKVLNFLKVETSETFFDKKKTKQMVNRVHLLCLVIHLLKASQNSCVGSVRKLNFNRKN